MVRRVRSTTKAPPPAMKPPPAAAEYELAVFKAATSFVAMLVSGPFNRQRHEFNNYPKAMECANGLHDAAGRQGLLYAVEPGGRSVCIDRKDRERYLALWKEKKS